jgi:2,4-dienoyl-CoA reductase-like NADH-dependent reductase (Old Yellow Enzyme family)
MKTLFDSTKIGQLTLQNRFIRSAIMDKTFDGRIDDNIIKTYAELAEGGVSAIVTGTTLVDGEEKILPVITLCSDSFIQGHKKLVESTHRHDVKIIAQLAYIGSYVVSGNIGGIVAIAPSSVANLITGTPAREMRLGEIKTLQKKFADAAFRAKKAGYDGVELHCAHSLLLSQFLTPYYNRRTDDYGGPIENRVRMIAETSLAVRRATGYDFPVWVKINSTDDMNDGMTESDFLAVCYELAKIGVDAIEVSGNLTRQNVNPGPYFKDAASAAAAENNVPIILTGGNRKITEMTETLNDTKISFFGLARPLRQDPGLINRFRAELDD